MKHRIATLVIVMATAELLQACDAPEHAGPTLVISPEAMVLIGRKLDPVPRHATVAIPASVLTAKPDGTFGPNLTEPMLITEPMPERFDLYAPRDSGLYKFEWQNMTPYLKSLRDKR